jgi:DnaJ-class molecular chaperone
LEDSVPDSPYELLGVAKTATQDEIRAAYRKLAKQLHPDLNPGDSKAEEKFKSVSVAYDLLSDPDKRARFDRGEIDASGAERPRERYYRDFQDAGAEQHAYSTGAGFADLDDVLSGLFRSERGGRTQFRMRGQDVEYRLAVDFLEAVNGANKRISLPDGSTLDVSIPAGIRDGQALRLRGKGSPGLGGGPPGDALVMVSIRAHPFFARKDDDIEVEVPITLREAVLGGRIEVPTTTGAVLLSVPKNASSGTRLRLKGKGVQRADGGRGDQYVVLKILLPERPDPELEAFVEKWTPAETGNPRQHLETAP